MAKSGGGKSTSRTSSTQKRGGYVASGKTTKSLKTPPKSVTKSSGGTKKSA